VSEALDIAMAKQICVLQIADEAVSQGVAE
jgi:hypothetical protein